MDETLKPCPFCGGEAEYHTDKGPTGEVYGWVGCNQCDAMSCDIDTRSMQPEETHPIDAWNTRADAARGDPVARVVEFIREQQANADKHMREAAHRKTESHFAAAFVTLRNLADAIERGEPFNG